MSAYDNTWDLDNVDLLDKSDPRYSAVNPIPEHLRASLFYETLYNSLALDGDNFEFQQCFTRPTHYE